MLNISAPIITILTLVMAFKGPRLLATYGMVLFLLPYRILAVLAERRIEQPRTGGWNTTQCDQRALDKSTRMAVAQVDLYSQYPIAADRGIRLARQLGYA